MSWRNFDIGKCKLQGVYYDCLLYVDENGIHHVTDKEGRPLVPEQYRKWFWSASTEEKVKWMFDRLVHGDCSAGWVAERLEHIGLIPEDVTWWDVKSTLAQMYECDDIGLIIQELRAMGVKV